MKISNFVFVFSAITSFNSYADVTGAGEAALYSQMVQMVATVKEELVTLKETLSIQEQLKDFEQLKEVRELSKAGSEFGKMFNDIGTIGNTLDDWSNDPFGTNEIQAEVERLEYMLERADSADGINKGKIYARMLRDLKNIQFLGTVNRENSKKLATGMNDNDAKKMSAESSLIMATIIEQQEMRNVAERNHSIDATQRLFGSTNYGALAIEEE